MQATNYLSKETIKQLNDYCSKKRLSLLQLSYELKISYPVLLYSIKGERKVTNKTSNAINQFLKNQDCIE